jgi:MFS family permease
MSFKLESITIFSLELSNFALLAFPLMLTGIGMGMSSVASTNVALDLMPDKVAEITGLRGMFRNTGAVIGVTGAIFLSNLFDSEAVGLMRVFLLLGIITILLIPTVFKMPNRPLLNS